MLTLPSPLPERGILLVMVCRLCSAVPSSAVSAWLKDLVSRLDRTFLEHNVR